MTMNGDPHDSDPSEARWPERLSAMIPTVRWISTQRTKIGTPQRFSESPPWPVNYQSTLFRWDDVDLSIVMSEGCQEPR